MRITSYAGNIMPDGNMDDAEVNDIWYYPLTNYNVILSKQPMSPPPGNVLHLEQAAPPDDSVAVAIFSLYAPPYLSGYTPPPFVNPIRINASFQARVSTPTLTLSISIPFSSWFTNNTNWVSQNWTDIEVVKLGGDPTNQIAIAVELVNPNPGDWAEINFFNITTDYEIISRNDQSCWNCDKFEPYDPATRRGGECRAKPPSRKDTRSRAGGPCSTFWDLPNMPPPPCWADCKGDSSYSWCAGWKRSVSAVPPLPPPLQNF